MSPKLQEPWLKKAEVAERLQVSVRTVERMGIPFFRVGGQNRYFMSKVWEHVRDSQERAA